MDVQLIEFALRPLRGKRFRTRGLGIVRVAGRPNTAPSVDPGRV